MGNLGEEIRRHREEAGMSQSALARGICSRPHLSRLERAEQRPGPGLLLRLCDRLKIDPDALLDSYLAESAPGVRSRLRLARMLASRGNIARAGTILRDVRGTSGGQHTDELLHTEAHLLRECGDYDRALPLCRRLVRSRLRRPSERFRLIRAQYLLGDTARHCGEHDLARDQLHRAFCGVLNLDPETDPQSTRRVVRLHRKVVISLATTLLYLRDFSAAENVLQLALLRWEELAFPPPPEIVRLQLGFARIGTRDLAGAAEILSPLAREGGSEQEAAVLCGLGIIDRLRGENEEATIRLLAAWRKRKNAGAELTQIIAHEMARSYLAVGDAAAAHPWVRRAAESADAGHDDPNRALQVLVLQMDLARETGGPPPRPPARLLEDIANSAAHPRVRCAAFLAVLRLARGREDRDTVERALRQLSELLSPTAI